MACSSAVGRLRFPTLSAFACQPPSLRSSGGSAASADGRSSHASPAALRVQPLRRCLLSGSMDDRLAAAQAALTEGRSADAIRLMIEVIEADPNQPAPIYRTLLL